MNRIEFHFDCLDGRYFFTAVEDDGIIRFISESTIAELESSEGELSKEDSELFVKRIDEAGIERWEKEYRPVLSKIEDGVKWKVILYRNEKEYVSKGEETYEPYGYDKLIDALRLCEGKASYFSAEANDE